MLQTITYFQFKNNLRFNERLVLVVILSNLFWGFVVNSVWLKNKTKKKHSFIKFEKIIIFNYSDLLVCQLTTSISRQL